jgi:hypothetical protein
MEALKQLGLLASKMNECKRRKELGNFCLLKIRYSTLHIN